MAKNQRSPDEWAQLIAEYKGSGLSPGEFIAKHRLTASNFYAWKKRLAGGVSDTGFTLVQSLVKPSPGGIKIELTNGIKIEIGLPEFSKILPILAGL